MKKVILALVVITLCLGVFNAFWFQKNEAQFVSYVDSIDLSSAVGDFDAFEKFTRDMVASVAELSDSFTSLVGSFDGIRNAKNFGDGVVGVFNILRAFVTFVVESSWHITVALVSSALSVFSLIGALFDFLLGL